MLEVLYNIKEQLMKETNEFAAAVLLSPCQEQKLHKQSNAYFIMK